MVVLRTPGSIVTRDIILATDITNIVGCLLGTAGYGQTISLTDKSDATNYVNVLGNADTTNGRALKVQYGTSTILATFAKAAIKLELPLTVKQVDLTDPGAGYTSFGARSADGAGVVFVGGGSQVLLANAADSPSTILTTTGDIIYASGAGVATRRAIGTTDQVLTVAGGVPTWANGSKKTLTTTGDILYASAANTLARVAIGTARQNLQVNTSADGFVYATSLQSLMTATGDIVQASSANTPARLAIGTARQNLAVNSGATAVEYVASLQSLMTATGDIVYASAANTPAKLAVGSNGNFLTLSSGIPAWSAGGAVSLTTVENDISGNVSLNNTSNYFDGPTVSLTTGTWLLVGAVHVQDTAGTANIAAKLWDGSTVESSGEVTIPLTNYGLMIPLAGIVTVSGTVSWKISVRDATSTSGVILATTVLVGTSGNNASFLRAVKIG